MNAARRKRLEKVISTLENMLDEIDNVKNEEMEAFENLPEGLQESERGEQMRDNAYNLDMAWNDLDNVIEQIREVVEA